MNGTGIHTVGTSAAASSIPLSVPDSFVSVYLLVLLSLLAILGLLLPQH
jgi:hypothetical protein